MNVHSLDYQQKGFNIMADMKWNKIMTTKFSDYLFLFIILVYTNSLVALAQEVPTFGNSASSNASTNSSKSNSFVQLIESGRDMFGRGDFGGAASTFSYAYMQAKSDREKALSLYLQGISETNLAGSQVQMNPDMLAKWTKYFGKGMFWGKKEAVAEALAEEQMISEITARCRKAGALLNQSQIICETIDRNNQGNADSTKLSTMIAIGRVVAWEKAGDKVESTCATQQLAMLDAKFDGKQVSGIIMAGVVLLTVNDLGIYCLERWDCYLSVQSRNTLLKWMKAADGFANDCGVSSMKLIDMPSVTTK